MNIRSAIVLFAAAVSFSAASNATPGKIVKCPATITVSGAYELTDNLDAIGTCITVMADFVTIDLAGWRIRGDGTGAAVTSLTLPTPIPVRATTVRNGSVTRFSNAIELQDGNVDELKSFDNTNVGILVVQGSVRNSLASGNSSNHGISVGPGSVVSGNVSTNNRTGISAGGFSVVIGNTVHGNTNGGISTLNSMNIVNNNASANGSFGIAVECPSLVLGNTAVGNAQNLLLIFAGCKDEHNVAP